MESVDDGDLFQVPTEEGYESEDSANDNEGHSFDEVSIPWMDDGSMSGQPDFGDGTSESNKESVSKFGFEPISTDFSWVTKGLEKAAETAGMKAESANDYTKATGTNTSNGYDLDTYLFAKGMLEGNKNDDYGNPIGWYGGSQTPGSLKKEAEEKRSRLREGSDEYNKLSDEIASYDKAIDAFQQYVDAYKDQFEKDENKDKYSNYSKTDSSKLDAAKKGYSDAQKALQKAQQNWSEFLTKSGVDWVDYSNPDALSQFVEAIHQKATAVQDKVNNDALNTAVNNATLSGKFFSDKGYGVDISWDSTGLKNIFSGGSKLGTAKIGNRTYDIVRASAGNLGDASIVTDSKGNPQIALSGFSTNAGEDKAHQDAIPAAIIGITNNVARDALERGVDGAVTNEEIRDAYNSMQTSLLEAKQALENVNNAAEAEVSAQEALEVATSRHSDDVHNRAKELGQKVVDAYAKGEISAFEAANSLANIQDSKLDFGMNEIVSKIDPEKDILGKMGDKISKAGIAADLSDMTNPVTASLVSEIQSLADLRKEVDKIDTSQITTIEQAEQAQTKTNQILEQYAKTANTELKDLVTSMLNAGGDLQEIAKSEEFMSLSQQIYDDAQAIYDKASAIEEIMTNSHLDAMDEKYIRDNLAVIQSQLNLVSGEPDYKMSLDEAGIQALAAYTQSTVATKDAALALMQSAAFNGAKDSKGEKWSEAWKSSKSLEIKTGSTSLSDIKSDSILTWTDWVASAARGTLGAVATAVGAALTTVNPALGGIVMAAGITSMAKTGANIAMKASRASSTNAEVMFGTSASDWKNVMNNIYNRSENPANIGDKKAVSTYTKTVGGMLTIVEGMMMFASDPVTGLGMISDGASDIYSVSKGGLQGNLDITIQNVYELGSEIIEFTKMSGMDIDDFMVDPSQFAENPNASSGDRDYDWEKIAIEEDKKAKGKKEAKSDYGVADSTTESAADDKYSGYKEQAKNSNLASDYNYGMEQNVNEAVSDKDVKGYIVTLYSKEPKWMRKAIDKVLAAHSEREW